MTVDEAVAAFKNGSTRPDALRAVFEMDREDRLLWAAEAWPWSATRPGLLLDLMQLCHHLGIESESAPPPPPPVRSAEWSAAYGAYYALRMMEIRDPSRDEGPLDYAAIALDAAVVADSAVARARGL